MFSPEEKYQIRMDELCQDSSKALFLKFSVHLQFLKKFIITFTKVFWVSMIYFCF